MCRCRWGFARVALESRRCDETGLLVTWVLLVVALLLPTLVVGVALVGARRLCERLAARERGPVPLGPPIERIAADLRRLDAERQPWGQGRGPTPGGACAPKRCAPRTSTCSSRRVGCSRFGHQRFIRGGRLPARSSGSSRSCVSGASPSSRPGQTELSARHVERACVRRSRTRWTRSCGRTHARSDGSTWSSRWGPALRLPRPTSDGRAGRAPCLRSGQS